MLHLGLVPSSSVSSLTIFKLIQMKVKALLTKGFLFVVINTTVANAVSKPCAGRGIGFPQSPLPIGAVIPCFSTTIATFGCEFHNRWHGEPEGRGTEMDLRTVSEVGGERSAASLAGTSH